MCTRVGVLDRGRLVLQEQLDALLRPTGLVERPDPGRLPGGLAARPAGGHGRGRAAAGPGRRPGGPERATWSGRASAWPRSARTVADLSRWSGGGGVPVIRVELIKLLRRPRTWLIIGMLVALPTLVAVLLAITDLGPRPGTDRRSCPRCSTTARCSRWPRWAWCCRCSCRSPSRCSAATRSPVRPRPGRCATCWSVRSGGPTCCWPSWSPSSRSWCWPCWWSARSSYVEGRLLLGQPPAGGGTVSLSGSTLTQQELSRRTALALAYVIICMLGVAAVALFLSTLTTSSIGAALGTVGVLIASTVLLGLDAAAGLHPLPAHALLAGLRRPVPRPDPVGRRGARAGGAARLPAGLRAGRVGELQHQGHHRLD